MDDDDMLHKDAVKQIQDCCKEKTKLKVCGFKNGVTWNVKENTYAQYWRKCDIGFIGIGESLISDVKFYKQTGFHIFSFAPSIIRTEIIKKSFNPEWQIIQNIFPSFIYSRYSDQSSMHIKGWVKRTHFSKNTVEKKIIKKYF